MLSTSATATTHYSDKFTLHSYEFSNTISAASFGNTTITEPPDDPTISFDTEYVRVAAGGSTIASEVETYDSDEDRVLDMNWDNHHELVRPDGFNGDGYLTRSSANIELSINEQADAGLLSWGVFGSLQAGLDDFLEGTLKADLFFRVDNLTTGELLYSSSQRQIGPDLDLTNLASHPSEGLRHGGAMQAGEIYSFAFLQEIELLDGASGAELIGNFGLRIDVGSADIDPILTPLPPALVLLTLPLAGMLGTRRKKM